jgi:hypothetical protein
MMSIRGVEYVVTDDAENLIAVVRPLVGRPSPMPRWAEDNDAFVVVGPDVTSGLAVRSGRGGFWRQGGEDWVLVEGSDLVGMIAPGRWGTYTFRECTCGQPRDSCQCGGRHGTMRRLSRADDAWTVVNAADHELAGITPRRFAMDLGPEDMRANLGRWQRKAHSLFMTETIRSFGVVHTGPGLDWHRMGSRSR